MFSLTATPCAYVTCDEKCYAETLSDGKFRYLPTCEDHREVITQTHMLYKKIAELRSELIENEPFNEDQLIHLLGMELRGREIQLHQIKEMYRDEGHYQYYGVLFHQYNSMLRDRANSTIKH